MYQTFIMIKPDSASQPKRVEAIFKLFKEHHLQVRNVRKVVVTKELILDHYDEVIEQQAQKDVFANRVLKEFVGQTVLIATVKGKGDVIKKVRQLVGVTQPLLAGPKTIRGRFGNKDSYALSEQEDRVVRNVIHSSDSEKSFVREHAIWYKK